MPQKTSKMIKQTLSCHIFEYGKLSDGYIPLDSHFNRKQIIEFLRKYRDARKASCIGNIQNRKIEFKEDDLYNNSSNVGILNLPSTGITLEFRPKLDKGSMNNFWAFLPRMLHCLCDFDDFNDRVFLDPEVIIDLPRGNSMVPLFALSLATLCGKAIKTGLLKKYLPRNERLKKIKGKIDFGRLSREKAWDLSSVPCRYFDLTFDNHENQIILWCINRLLHETKQLLSQKNPGEPRIVKILREQFVLLSQEITLIPKTRSSVLEVNYSSLPSHYLDLMKLCRGILTESLFSFLEKETQMIKGINFLIDMDWVFEQYMTSLFKEVSKNNEFKGKIIIRDQERQSLCDRNRIKIRPDLMIYNSKNQPKAVIDFKWKESPGSGDNDNLYQVICYGLAQLQKINKIDANLFYALGEDEDFDKISKIFNQEKVLSIKKMGLQQDVFRGNADAIEESIKTKISGYLKTLCT